MTLQMRDQENIEKGRREGRNEGRNEAIHQLVSALRDFAISDEAILQKIQEKFQLSEKEAKQFVFKN